MKFSPKQREALNLVADGKFIPCFVKEDDGWHARWRAIGIDDEGVDGWVDEYVRESTVTRLSEDAEDQKHETLHDAWILALRSRTGLVVWDVAECAEFAAELEAWGGNAEEDRISRGAIVFRFRTAVGSDRIQSANQRISEKAEFELFCDVPKGRRALKALGQAVYVWSPLVGLKKSTSRLCVKLNKSEAEDLIRHAARELRDAGYAVEGVDLAAEITASAEVMAAEGGLKSATPNMRLTVRVAGEPVTADEIRFLLDQGSSLVYFRDRWIEVDRGILKEALRALEKGAGKNANALTFALGIGHIGSLEIEEVKSLGWLR